MSAPPRNVAFAAGVMFDVLQEPTHPLYQNGTVMALCEIITEPWCLEQMKAPSVKASLIHVIKQVLDRPHLGRGEYRSVRALLRLHEGLSAFEARGAESK
jgi:hypothetical protein